MINKRVVISGLMDHSGFLNLAAVYRRQTNNEQVVILAYHRVVNNDPISMFDFDEALVSAFPHDFESQIKWLKTNFNIISFATLLKGAIKPNSVIITFDDGYKDNYKNVYPVLRKYNVPATIFLTTDYIGTSKIFWWDEISYLIKKAVCKKVKVDYLNRTIAFDLVTQKNRNNAIRGVLKLVKQIPDNNRKDIINKLRDALGIEQNKQVDTQLILSWDNVRKMSKSGIEFGSHSVSHPVLTNVDTASAKYEVEESKKKIESEIEKEVIAFSYPVGGGNCFSEKTMRLVENAGYKYAVSYMHGKNFIRRLDRFCLKRIHIESNESFSIFKAKVMFPGIMRY